MEADWLEDEPVPVIQTEFCLVKEVLRLTKDVVRIKIKTLNKFHFLAGQFAELTFGDLPPRNYSMANKPGEDLEFYIRLIPGGRASAYVEDHLKLGSPVKVHGPFGMSYLGSTETGPILAVAGSTGIAPILSILRQAEALMLRQRIEVYFGVRGKDDFFALEELIALKARMPSLMTHLVAVEQIKNDRFRHGHVGHVVLEDWNAFTGNWSAFVAGPPPMVEPLVLELRERGIANVYSDPFTFQTDALTRGIE